MKRRLSILVPTFACLAVSLSNADLPLERVVLFRSGVGYFEHVTEVSDAESAELAFDKEQMLDVIKSLVIVDEADGSVSAVTYDSRDPVERTLRSFSIDLTHNPDMPALLNQLRGVAIRVVTSAGDVQGQIVGVESRDKKEGDAVYEQHILNLLGEETLQAIPLDSVRGFKILDRDLDKELRSALDVLADALDKDKKNVRFDFDGEGKRTVRVGYIVETPVWKTSYRLVLGSHSPFLQGWAHVENTTDADWSRVGLSLVAGRPTSFIQNLYDPLYVRRPVVRMGRFGGVVPPLHGDDRDAIPSKRGSRRRMEPGAEAPTKAEAQEEDRWWESQQPPASPMGGARAKPSAEARRAGELFEYAVNEPVTLPRRRSAMIPVVNQALEGRTVSIFNAAVNDRYPLNSVEMDNTSGLHLMQGPVTVFEDGIYAGDARLSHTQPGEKAMLSYAVDLAVEAGVEENRKPAAMVKIHIVKGLLHLTREQEVVYTYRFTSKRDEVREVVVEHPVHAGWDLLARDRPDERTRDVYRFRLSLDPRVEKQLEVKERRVLAESVMLTNLSDDRIGLYLKETVISRGMEKAFQKLVEMKTEARKLTSKRIELEKEVAEITSDQHRVRENMRTVSGESESYVRWERKLIRQEDRLDEIRRQLDIYRQDERKQKRDVDR